MASIEFIAKRIEGKEKELDKLNKKLARIRKVEAQNWEDPNPYYYSEYDLKCTMKDIEAAQKALDDYKAQLIAENEKAASRNVQVIIDFLNGRKQRKEKTMKAQTNKQKCKNCAHKCVCPYQSYYENLEGVEKCKHYWSKQKAFEEKRKQK